MKDAHVLNRVHKWPVLPPEPRFKPLAGRLAVLMCPTPETSDGGIYLTDRTSGNLRPDAGVVVASHDLEHGTRGYVRPGVGMYYDSPEGWYRLLGREVFKGEGKLSAVDIYEHFVAFDVDGEIVPTPGNVLVEFVYESSVILALDKPKTKAVIRAVGEGSEYSAGEVACIVDSGYWLQFGDLWIIPESDIGVTIEQAA